MYNYDVLRYVSFLLFVFMQKMSVHKTSLYLFWPYFTFLRLCSSCVILDTDLILSADVLFRTPRNPDFTYFGVPSSFANDDRSAFRSSTALSTRLYRDIFPTMIPFAGLEYGGFLKELVELTLDLDT